MVSPQKKVSSRQIRSEVLRKNYHGQQLSSSNTIPSFRFAEYTASVRNNSLCPLIVNLRQYSANPDIAGICVQDEWTLEIWVGQHRRGGQPTAKLFKGPFPLLRPAKRGSTLCKTVQWLGHVRELWNKPSVITGKAQEPLDLLGSGWCWPFCNFLHLRWVRSNTISGYDKPQVLDPGLEKGALCGFQLQPGFSEKGEHCPQILQVFCECLPDDNIVQVHQIVRPLETR